jgi:hypothetical protein
VNGIPTRRVILVLVPLIVLFSAGCVSLPANTAVNSVSKQANTGSGSDVRIWPQGPTPQDRPEAIVEGFLQTAASDPTNVDIAKAYLTGDALKNWDPGKVVVFSEESSVTPIDNEAAALQLNGTEVATVSDTGVYQPVQNPQPTAYRFHVVHDAKNGYRIDELPLGGDFGIPLTQEAFRSDYTTYYLYYVNQDAPAESMIPIPVYLRTQSSDAATAQTLAGALLKGPPDWLAGAAGIATPQIALAAQNPVVIGPDDTALVSVKSPNYCTAHNKAACSQLADEMLATFSTLGSISRVKVVDAAGATLGASLSVDEVMTDYHIGVVTTKSFGFYYLDSANQRVTYSDGRNAPITEQVGPGDRKYSQLAVTGYRKQTIAAVVDNTGTKLYLGVPGSTDPPVLVKTQHKISWLTWDALGHLWFLDTNGGIPSVYRLDIANGLQAAPQLVDVYGTDGVVQKLSVAPDGRRIAVVYGEPGAAIGTGPYSLAIGIVDDAASQLSINLDSGINQPVVNEWTNIVDADWHGSQSLAVLGSPLQSSPLAIYELNPDGSPVVSSSDLNAVTINPPSSATGIEWSGNALLASYSTGQGATAHEEIELYSFVGGAWVELTGVHGTAPTYVD